MVDSYVNCPEERKDDAGKNFLKMFRGMINNETFLRDAEHSLLAVPV